MLSYTSKLLDLKTDFETNAKGIVLESKIDIGRGPVANIIITAGTLKKGDYFVSGLKWGKIRAIINDLGKNIDNAEPATPVEIIIGFPLEAVYPISGISVISSDAIL